MLWRHHASLIVASIIGRVLLVERTLVPLAWSIIKSLMRRLAMEALIASLITTKLQLLLLILVSSSTLILVLYSASFCLKVLAWVIWLLLEA